MRKLGYVKDRNGFDPEDVNLAQLTHISYSFAKVADKNGTVYEEFLHAHKLVKFKELNPGVQVLLAIGGWTAGNFSEAALTASKRENFAKTAIDILKKYDMDGIDLDWEYPNSSESGITSHPNDRDNFTLLIKEIRKQLEQLSDITKKYYSITFACGATPKMLESYDFKLLNELTDFMNLMTYDMGGSYSTTGFHTNLFPSLKTKQPGGAHYVDLFVKAGYSKEKIIYGAAFYGRGGSGLSNNNEDHLNEYIYTEKGLYFDYHEILEIIESNNLTIHYDDEAVGAYIYYNDTFISFDTPQTIIKKLQYVKENNLFGIMFWEYETDKSRTLIKTILEYK